MSFILQIEHGKPTRQFARSRQWRHAPRVCVRLTATLWPSSFTFQFGRFSAASYVRVIAKVWQLDAHTLWASDATVASEQTAEFVFRVPRPIYNFFLIVRETIIL